MYIKASFTTRYYWQVAMICNFAKLLGAKTTFYSGGTGSDYNAPPCSRTPSTTDGGK